VKILSLIFIDHDNSKDNINYIEEYFKIFKIKTNSDSTNFSLNNKLNLIRLIKNGKLDDKYLINNISEERNEFNIIDMNILLKRITEKNFNELNSFFSNINSTLHKKLLLNSNLNLNSSSSIDINKNKNFQELLNNKKYMIELSRYILLRIKYFKYSQVVEEYDSNFYIIESKDDILFLDNLMTIICSNSCNIFFDNNSKNFNFYNFLKYNYLIEFLNTMTVFTNITTKYPKSIKYMNSIDSNIFFKIVEILKRLTNGINKIIEQDFNIKLKINQLLEENENQNITEKNMSQENNINNSNSNLEQQLILENIKREPSRLKKLKASIELNFLF